MKTELLFFLKVDGRRGGNPEECSVVYLFFEEKNDIRGRRAATAVEEKHRSILYSLR